MAARKISTFHQTLTLPIRVKILLAEMELLQSRFDKYDTVFMSSRKWLITIILAALGGSLYYKCPTIALVSCFLPAIFFIVEVLWRFLYWYRFVVRYEYIRDRLNNGKSIESLSVYDLTNEYGEWPGWAHRMKKCLIKFEPLFFYGFITMISLIFAHVFK